VTSSRPQVRDTGGCHKNRLLSEQFDLFLRFVALIISGIENARNMDLKGAFELRI